LPSVEQPTPDEERPFEELGTVMSHMIEEVERLGAESERDLIAKFEVFEDGRAVLREFYRR
jgi:hypothetical protein